ncbi:MAG: PEP-CTERM sorting domain-containing protein [Pirellulales bacterium]|nr:PEP-CTERM sorting domain-containing protein [Pirellulales bacterium]
MKRVIAIITLLTIAGWGSTAGASVFNGHVDYQVELDGYYAVITGGLFPNGQTRTGIKSTGGTMFYLFENTDNSEYIPPRVPQAWNRDGWFTATSGVALTMRDSSGAIVYDNNGIDTGLFPTDFYGKQDGSEITPGLYWGYSMANNDDWIYAGYFRLTEETTISEISGYFSSSCGGEIDLSYPFDFAMNIFSEEDGTMMPTNTGGFDGDVFCSDFVPGTFSISDTNVDRIYEGVSWSPTDRIMRLTYTLDSPVTLPAGEYYFSHTAQVVPEPASLAIWCLLGLAFAGGAWRNAFLHRKSGRRS